MGRLKNALENHLVSHKEDVEVHMPRNLEPLLLEFETKKNSTKVAVVLAPFNFLSLCFRSLEI